MLIKLEPTRLYFKNPKTNLVEKRDKKHRENGSHDSQESQKVDRCIWALKNCCKNSLNSRII